VLTDLVGFRDLLVLNIAAGGVFAARRLEVGVADTFRTHGKAGDQLLQVLALARGACDDRGLQYYQLELVSAGATGVIVDRHGPYAILANAAARWLFHGAQLAANVQGGEDPGGVTLVPLEVAAGERAAQVVEHKVPAEGQFQALDVKAKWRAVEGFEILSREVLEAGGGQVADVGGIGVGIVRAEVRRGDEHAGAGLSDAVDLRHGRDHVVDMLDDMREMDALEAVGGERPGILVEVPNDVGGWARGPVDAERVRLCLAGAAADVEDDALVEKGVGVHGLGSTIKVKV
jgi:hypothetical protein